MDEEEEELEIGAAPPIADDDEDDDVVADPTAVEASFDELVAKHPEVVEDDEDDPMLDLTREERLEALSIRAAPKQANEFVCTNCHLVKHQSQMADRKRELCRDCV